MAPSREPGAQAALGEVNTVHEHVASTESGSNPQASDVDQRGKVRAGTQPTQEGEELASKAGAGSCGTGMLLGHSGVPSRVIPPTSRRHDDSK